ncbi:MAG: hypothetical protein RBS80_14380 [Thermoguttaceae bacterium]|nr:hypothetical protein [Thermoguttaceae bacterium]
MRNLHIAACCLLVSAIALDIASKTRYSLAARWRAEGVEAQPTEQEHVKQESETALAGGNRLALGGLVTAFGGLVLWCASVVVGRTQGRRFTPVIPLALLAAYMLLFFVAV